MHRSMRLFAIRGALVGWLVRRASGLRFPWLLGVTATLLVVDLLIPDTVPFLDELVLALATAVLASLRKPGSAQASSSSSPNRPNTAPVVAAALLGLAAATPAAAVSSADEVCAAAADPCVVSGPITVDDGAVLDFGLRTLRIEGSGVLDFGAGSATVRAGRVEVATSATATPLVLHGDPGDGTVSGGQLLVEARRACSDDEQTPCLDAADCATMGATCSVGDGGVSLGGKLSGEGVTAASAAIRAAGDISVSRPVNLSGTTKASDGGELELTSLGGSVAIDAKIDVSSGGDGLGGDLNVSAAFDITTTAVVDAFGGDSDGGYVELTAEGDVTVGAEINLNSASGAGFGGELGVSAGRDVRLGLASGTTRILVNGHTDADNLGGDGGVVTVLAARDVLLDTSLRLSIDGSRPDAAGGSAYIDAAGDIRWLGQVTANADGSSGYGGILEATATGNFTIGPVGRIQAAGAGGGPGSIAIMAGANLELEGGSLVDAGSSSGAEGGPVVVGAGGTVSIAGTVTTNGPAEDASTGTIDIDGCRIVVAAGGHVDNNNTAGINTFRSGDSALVATGGQVTTTAGGVNHFLFRNLDKPPVYDGTVSPSPLQTPDSRIPACGVCGNAELDPEEDCDEGLANSEDPGSWCRADCSTRACGVPVTGGARPLATDALFVLRTGVDLEDCDLRVCDLDDSGAVSATDALTDLLAAVSSQSPSGCPTP
jgi:hypothetical protein